MPTDHALPSSPPAALTLPAGTAGAPSTARSGASRVGSRLGLDRRRHWAFMPLCVAGSFAAHGVAYAALSHVGIVDGPRRLPPIEITMDVVAPPAPALPELVAAPEPAPPPPVARVTPKPAKPRSEPAPEQAPTVAPPAAAEPAPPLQTLGVSESTGLAVAGQVGSGGALVGSLSGVRGGVVGGTGSAPAAPPALDLRKLTSEWASQVSLAIGKRAVHAYPRSALRARVQGTVLLSVRVGIAGQIEDVAVARSSGSPQLDEAALAAARELGAVPAPPAALHRYLRPFPVPVNYVIQG
jgi:periplasmic protein TonB